MKKPVLLFEEFISSKIYENLSSSDEIKKLVSSDEIRKIIPKAPEIIDTLLKIKSLKTLEKYKDYLEQQRDIIYKSGNLQFYHQTAINPDFAQILCIKLWQRMSAENIERGIQQYKSAYIQTVMIPNIMKEVSNAKGDFDWWLDSIVKSYKK
jgi:hypothetical protein